MGNGSGWTSEGLDAYNKIHELVKEDRLKNGDQFNRELTKAITERHNKRKSSKDSNTQVTPPKRKKPIPVDDLDEMYGCLSYANTTQEAESILTSTAAPASCQVPSNVTPVWL